MRGGLTSSLGARWAGQRMQAHSLCKVDLCFVWHMKKDVREFTSEIYSEEFVKGWAADFAAKIAVIFVM